MTGEPLTNKEKMNFSGAIVNAQGSKDTSTFFLKEDIEKALEYLKDEIVEWMKKSNKDFTAELFDMINTAFADAKWINQENNRRGKTNE